MGRYTYECSSCGHLFEERHSYKICLENCPECKKEKSLRKIMCIPVSIRRGRTFKKKSGKLVNSTIKEIKQELQAEKNNLKNRKKK